MKSPRRVSLFTLTFGVVVLAASLLSADTIADHQRSQSRPIQLGTSGGNINDRSTVWCCSGTLGALVTIGSTQYVLSNNHVLARTNRGVPGDAITQPGLIDESPVCSQNLTDAVAYLTQFVPINFKKGTTNTVDAAIAEVASGAVDSSGAILGIGTVGAPVAPALNMAVQKSGRTTGVTSGVVAATSVTISVKYGSQCGGGRGTGTFKNQIRITPGTFSDGGDSGSLIVTTGTSPQAVGLLFAGGTNDTFANPIQAVLDALGASMVVGAASGRFRRWFARLLPAVSRAHAASPSGPIHPASQAAAEHAKERNERALLAIQGVVGVGVGVSETVAGEAVVEVYVEKSTPAVRSAVPGQVDGVPVKVVETGEIKARGGACPYS
jgi:hypothetical protein